jgi:hypothetical protein
MSVCSAIEPPRAAKRLLGRESCRWALLSADGPIGGRLEAELVLVRAGLHANARPRQAVSDLNGEAPPDVAPLGHPRPRSAGRVAAKLRPEGRRPPARSRA